MWPYWAIILGAHQEGLQACLQIQCASVLAKSYGTLPSILHVQDSVIYFSFLPQKAG